MPNLELIPPSAAPDLVPKKSGTSSYNRVETLPGLDSYADRPEAELEAHALGPLLAWARAVIPARQLHVVPIFLFATAGVRRMQPAKQHLLMERARDVLRRSAFRFEPAWARIISGTDEGVYGWIAINYLRGHLDGPTRLAVAHAVAAAARAGGTRAAAAVAAAMGRRGASGAPVSAHNAAGVAAAGAGMRSVPVATVGSLDLGGSSLEMVYCSDVVSREGLEAQRHRLHSDVSGGGRSSQAASSQAAAGVVVAAAMQGGPGGRDTRPYRGHVEGATHGRKLHARLQEQQEQQQQWQEAQRERVWGQGQGQRRQAHLQPGEYDPGIQRGRRTLLGRPLFEVAAGHRGVVVAGAGAEAGAGAVRADASGGGAGGIGGAEAAAGLPSRLVLLGPRSYTLRTHTFHKYGLNDAFDRSVSLLLLDTLVPPPLAPSPKPPYSPPPSPRALPAGTQPARQMQPQGKGQAGMAAGAGTFATRPQRPTLVRQGELQPPTPASPSSPPTPPTRPSPLRLGSKGSPHAGADSGSVGGALSSATALRGSGVGASAAGTRGNATSAAGATMGGVTTASTGGRNEVQSATVQHQHQYQLNQHQHHHQHDQLQGEESVWASGAGGGAGAGSSAAQGQSPTAAARDTHSAAAGSVHGARTASATGAEMEVGATQSAADGTAQAANTSTAASGAGSGTGASAGTAAGGGGGGTAAAKLRTQAVVLEQQKRDSERIIKLVKEQLSAAQEREGNAVRGGGSGGGSATAGAAAQGAVSGLADRTVAATAAHSRAATGNRGGAADEESSTAATTSTAAIPGRRGGRLAAGGAALRSSVAGMEADVARLRHGGAARSASTLGAGGDGDGGAVGRALMARSIAASAEVFAAGEDAVADVGGGEESLSDATVWVLQLGAEALVGADALSRARLAHRDLLAASQGGGDVDEGGSLSGASIAGNAGKRAAEVVEEHGGGDGALRGAHTAAAAVSASEKGLAEAAGLAAAAAAAAAAKSSVATVGGAGGSSGVLVVGRDDKDVSGRGQQHALVLRHPCMHEGFSKSYNRIHQYGVLAELPGVQLVGGSDWSACLELVARAVNASAGCGTGRHCVLGSAQPELKGPFVALAGFYVVWTFFGLGSADSPAAVLQAARSHCSRPWRDVESRLGHHINVEKYCLWGPYVAQLLTAGLGLTANEFTIGSGDVGWPIGAALAEAMRLPGMGPELPLLPRLASRVLPAAWLQSADGYGTAGGWRAETDSSNKGFGGGGQEEARSLGVGLGWSISLMWAAFLVLFLAWCSFYMAARSWLRTGSGGGGGGTAGWRVGSGGGAGGLLLAPFGGRARQPPQRRLWLA